MPDPTFFDNEVSKFVIQHQTNSAIVTNNGKTAKKIGTTNNWDTVV